MNKQWSIWHQIETLIVQSTIGVLRSLIKFCFETYMILKFRHNNRQHGCTLSVVFFRYWYAFKQIVLKIHQDCDDVSYQNILKPRSHVATALFALRFLYMLYFRQFFILISCLLSLFHTNWCVNVVMMMFLNLNISQKHSGLISNIRGGKTKQK